MCLRCVADYEKCAKCAVTPALLARETPESTQLKTGDGSIASPLPAENRPTIGKPVAAITVAPSPSAENTHQCDCGNFPPKMSRFCNMCGESMQSKNGEEQDTTGVEFLKAVMEGEDQGWQCV